MHDHGQVGRALGRGDAKLAHFLGQAGLGLRHAVLNELRRLVRIGTEREGDGQRHGAVGRRLAVHIEHAFDAVDGLLDRRRHGFGDDARIGAGIGGAHHDGGRHDFRIFRDRHGAQRQQAGQEDDDRQHAGENRPVDEKA